MSRNSTTIVVIGAGIAGLCTAIYALKCGYRVILLEKHTATGGLATSWKRGPYTFETCIHWLLGSDPNGSAHDRWREVFDISQLTFHYPRDYARIETEHGDHLDIPTNVERLESELTRAAPEDAAAIHDLASSIRRLAGFQLPQFSAGGLGGLRAAVGTLPKLLLLRRWSGMTLAEFGRGFKNPLLRAWFESGENAQLAALGFVMALTWMGGHDAGYPIGGSRSLIQPLEDNFRGLGGNLRLGAKVVRILTTNDSATGVELASGEVIPAHWVISAADGHTTVYDLLGGLYTDSSIEAIYRRLTTFPSYVQVSLGIARDLTAMPGFITRILDAPLRVDRATCLQQISFRIFNFDPTLAPRGKTAVTCFLPTRDFDYWTSLERDDPTGYRAEKSRIADAVIAILERGAPGLTAAIEQVDVSTPATVIRVTGNWHGSMEGWMMTPSTGYRPLRNTLPGLSQFLMVGHWVMPGGGLPSGLITARSAIQSVCSEDGVPFNAGSLPGNIPLSPCRSL